MHRYSSLMAVLTLLSVGIAMVVVPSSSSADEPRIPVLLDTDIGSNFDDALALSLLLTNPRIELRAVTTSGGDCEDRAWIVCRLLSMVGRKEIAVGWGRDPQPEGEVKEMFQYRYHPAVLFNRTFKPVPDKDAADLLYEKLKESPKGEAILLAIGPLTNVARLLEKHPDSKEMLKSIVIRGGTLRTADRPESNIQRDVISAQKVLDSGVPVVFVPLESAGVKLTAMQRNDLFAAQTMLTQQLQTLYELRGDESLDVFDAVAACFLSDIASSADAVRIVINDAGMTRHIEGEANASITRSVDAESFAKAIASIGKHGPKTQPRPLSNVSKPIDRAGLPTRVHAFEDYETEIERRWWLAGRPITNDVPSGSRAMQSVLTLDFDDLQGDLKSMYSAVVFNPVPGPPMGPKTRLSFRYKLQRTDQLRVQLYSLSNGYHRYLALQDLPQDTWQQATVDMTEMRRPDGTGGALSEDERIDDVQFYVEPQGHVAVDDVILYEAASAEEKLPFPKRVVFTGWFDTGKQGKEWPGDYEIIEHEKPLKWKAAKSVLNKELGHPWLRISFRGDRPIGTTTVARFRYRLKGANSLTVQLASSKSAGLRMQQHVENVGSEDWRQLSLSFSLADARNSVAVAAMKSADELRFMVPANGELLIDDLLVYEPNQ